MGKVNILVALTLINDWRKQTIPKALLFQFLVFAFVPLYDPSWSLLPRPWVLSCNGELFDYNNYISRDGGGRLAHYEDKVMFMATIAIV